MQTSFAEGAVLDDRRRALRRQRAFATGLLVAMAALFLATYVPEGPGFWILLVRAGAEAALVGGLADWFAVTALFRRPLGLPIPHTALVPRKKDELASGLAAFVERNFLTADVILGRLRDLGLVEAVARWLAQRENAERVAGRAVAVLPFVLDSLRDRHIRRFVRSALRAQLGRLELAPLLGRGLRLLTAHGQHRLLLEQAALALRRLLAENEEMVYAMVEERSRWWIPRTVDRRVARALVAGLFELLQEIGEDGHPVRRRFEVSLAELAERLETSPETGEAVARLWEQLLSDPVVLDYLGSVWDEARRLILQDVSRPEPRLRSILAGALAALAQGLLADPAVRDRLTARLETFVVQVVVPWRREIGGIIVGVVASWDARTLTERIELEVGGDLQFVRVNGTIVGALVGCTIFLLARAFLH